jgi:hypothetical protein
MLTLHKGVLLQRRLSEGTEEFSVVGLLSCLSVSFDQSGNLGLITCGIVSN